MSVISNKQYAAFESVMTETKEFIRAVKNREIKKASEIVGRLSSLEDNIKDYLNATKNSDQLRPAKETFNKMFRTAKGIRNGVEQRMLNLTTFRQEVARTIYKQHFSRLLQFQETLDVESEVDHSPNEVDQSTVKRISKERGSKAALEYMQNSKDEQIQRAAQLQEDKQNSIIRRENDRAHKAELARKSAIAKYQSIRNKLPSKLKGKAFTVIQLPIVPVFDNPILMSPSHARKAGIKTDELKTGHVLNRDIGGIAKKVDAEDVVVVFKDQTLLAFDINHATAELDSKGNVKRRERVTDSPVKGKSARRVPTNSLKTRKRAARDHELIQDFLVELLERINHSSPIKYDIVSDHYAINSSNPDIRFAWLMPKQQKNAYTRSAGAAKGLWNFPWQDKGIL